MGIDLIYKKVIRVNIYKFNYNYCQYTRNQLLTRGCKYIQYQQINAYGIQVIWAILTVQ